MKININFNPFKKNWLGKSKLPAVQAPIKNALNEHIPTAKLIETPKDCFECQCTKDLQEISSMLKDIVKLLESSDPPVKIE